MIDFFNAMDSTERVYWYIAMISTVIFVIQTVMTFMGADADTGMEADFDSNLDGDGHAFQLFSLRNLVGFFLGFGWAGVTLYGVIDSKTLLGIVAFIVGAIFVGVFFLILRTFMNLAEDNTFKIEDTIGKTAEVYTRIPANSEGRGKVSVSVAGSLRELEAISSGAKEFAPMALVKVVDVKDNMLIVEAM